MRNIIYIVSCLTTAVFFMTVSQSCTKEDNLAQQVSVNSDDSSLAKLNAYENWPTSRDGRFVFADFAEFQSTYQQLENELQEGGPGLMLRKYDDEGNELYKNRPPVSTVFNGVLNDYFVNVEDRYQPFVTDQIMMQLLNEHFEFQLGNVIVTYVSNSDLILSKENDTATLNEVRAMEKGVAPGPNDIPALATWAPERQMEEAASLFGLCGCKIDIKQIDCCTVRVFGNCKNFVGADGNGIVTIEFEVNGQVPAAFSEIHSVNGNFEFIFENLCSPSWWNPNPSSMLIRAFADSGCITGGTSTHLIPFQPNNSCDDNEKDSGWLWAASGIEGMSHRTQNYTGPFSYYEAAEIYSKKWVDIDLGFFQFQGWFPSNATSLEVSIDATRLDEVCNIDQEEDETNDCDDCSHKTARVNTGIWGGFNNHCTGDVVGTFEKIAGSIALNRTHVIEYYCCQ